MPANADAQKGQSVISAARTISIFGLTESAASEQLSNFKEMFPHLGLEFQTEPPAIKILLYTLDSETDKLKPPPEDSVQWVCRKLGNHVFSDRGESMERVVGMLLQQQNATLAVAESCTGGLIAHLLTDVPGSSDYFLLSAVTYANHAKLKILDVRSQTLERYGAVSEQTAAEMAEGARNCVDATYGLSTSGIAGPAGGSDDKPVGTVCVGLATPSSVTGYRFTYSGYDRKSNKQLFAITALNLLREELLRA